MKKFIILVMMNLIVFCFTSCSKKDISTYDDYKNEQFIIDYKSFDIDNDGIIEDCYITIGPTSGIFTFYITAIVNDNVKYRDLFTDQYSDISFCEYNNVNKLKMIRSDYMTDEQYTEYHEIHIIEGHIVID